MPTGKSAAIQVDRIKAERLQVPIVGTSPLICHRFSEKARQSILDAQQGRTPPKEPRDPDQEYEDSLYRIKGGGYGFPTQAFRSATIGAARFYGSKVTMTGLRAALVFTGEPDELDGQALVRLTGEPRLREDYVRLAGKSATVTFRAEFVEWSAMLEVIYVTSLVSRDSVVSLIDAGGLGVGVGDWRQERNGSFGAFQVDPTREVLQEKWERRT